MTKEILAHSFQQVIEMIEALPPDDQALLIEIIRRRLIQHRWAGLTQEELTKRAGIGRVTLSRLESGDHSPRYRILVALAKALGVSVTDLLVDRTPTE
jgi:DNA-binding XRE family transcriptional regulator